MNARILIIEGTSGIGKSTLIDALVRKYISDNEKIRSLLHLAQAHTYGPLAIDEDHNTLTKEMNLKHLLNILQLLNWSVLSLDTERKVKFFCIIDTLHLTHCFRPGVLNWEDVVDYDSNLQKLNCKLIFMHAQPQTIWDRGIAPRMNGQFILEYGRKFGKNLKEIHQYFVDEQTKMENLLLKSGLEVLQIDAENDFSQNVKKSYSFWID